ncbi:heme exporter protein CcmD [Pseudocitrobacter cyperus]|uniref:Heme exporter protein D n=1 Tax=Pseudocitrobacter cyperus TaxID=3112843 RepID=A0ABV0HF75_9ENTR
MTPAFSSFAAFLSMGGYALYVWLSVATTLVVLLGLVGHSLWQHKSLLQAVRRQQRREQRLRGARERMNKEQVDARTP